MQYSSCLKYDDEYICDKCKYYSVYICFTLQRVVIDTRVHDAQTVVPPSVQETPVIKRMENVTVSINNL